MHEFLEISFLLNVDSESLLEMQVVEQMKKQWGLKKIAVIYLQKKIKMWTINLAASGRSCQKEDMQGHSHHRKR